tara:strand:+ start:6306 stop:6524 length:219 start_codon:yes stop_codon:yes gene_type:complete
MKKWIITQTLKNILGSKKAIYTIIGILVTLLSDHLGMDAETAKSLVYSITALVLGQSVADINKGACKNVNNK